MTYARPSALALALALAPIVACFDPPSATSGDDTGSTSGDTGSTSAPPMTSTDVDTGPDPQTDSTTSLDGGSTSDSSSGDPAPVCGDASIDEGEECDDANSDDGDGCSGGCMVETGHQCVGEPSVCSTICGDGMIVGSEECDDANPVPGDGCTACAVDPGYQCMGEPSVCVLPSCGDVVLSGPEACDDANMADGDGCSSACAVELYSRCTGEGPGSCAPIRILYAPADADDPMFRGAMAMTTGGAVDYFAAGTGTPNMGMLMNDYDCVITHPNQTYSDPAAFGALLANFVDADGNVVLGIASGYPAVGLVGTPITSPAYSPVTTMDIEFLPGPIDYAGDGSTVIHVGVMAYQAPIVDNGVALQGMGMTDSTFTNGYIATAYRPDFKVVYINGTGNASVGATGQWPLLFANGCAAGFVQ